VLNIFRSIKPFIIEIGLLFFIYPATPLLNSDERERNPAFFLSLSSKYTKYTNSRDKSGVYSAGRGPHAAATIVCGGPTSCAPAAGIETTAPSTPKKSHGPPDVLIWLMLRALLVRWTFMSTAIAMVYWAPAAPMSVAVTLPADGV
jgi:hypothetical protein